MDRRLLGRQFSMCLAPKSRDRSAENGQEGEEYGKMSKTKFERIEVPDDGRRRWCRHFCCIVGKRCSNIGKRVRERESIIFASLQTVSATAASTCVRVNLHCSPFDGVRQTQSLCQTARSREGERDEHHLN